MTAVVRLTGERELPIPEAYAWMAVLEFAVDGAGSDAELLAGILAHPRYDDGFLGPPSPEPSGVRGPYRLEALGAESFRPVGSLAARLQVRAWATECDPAIAASAEFEALLDHALPSDATVVELAPPREAEHEVGFLVGFFLGFHEFVAITAPRDRVLVLTATDD